MTISPQKMATAKRQKRAAHAYRGPCQYPKCGNEWTAFVVPTRRGYEAHCRHDHPER